MRSLFLRARDLLHRPPRAIVTWEHLRISGRDASPDHPFFYDFRIVEWCRDNIEGRVFIRQYDRFTNKLKQRVEITHELPCETSDEVRNIYYDSYGFIRGQSDFLVHYMDLEFPSEGERALFLLTWQGRVEKIDAIPFIKH